MPIDDLYTLMCDCPEIQEGHEWKDGDLYVYRMPEGYPHGQFTDVRLVYPNSEWPRDKAIWLPDQDDLDGMLDLPLPELVYKFMYFCDRYEGTTGGEVWGEFNEYCQQFTSMKQLKLAFYMKEKRHKIWDGKSWEAQDIDLLRGSGLDKS